MARLLDRENFPSAAGMFPAEYGFSELRRSLLPGSLALRLLSLFILFLILDFELAKIAFFMCENVRNPVFWKNRVSGWGSDRNRFRTAERDRCKPEAEASRLLAPKIYFHFIVA